MFALAVFREIFVQKHLVVQMQQSRLSPSYQLLWIEVCTRVVKSTPDTLKLIDFCTLLCENFAPSRRRIFKNDQLKAQLFMYSMRRDNCTRFSATSFLEFLKRFPIDGGYENDAIRILRLELIKLFSHLNAITSSICTTNTSSQSIANALIRFDNWRDYRHIFAHLDIRYEFDTMYDTDGQRKMNIFVANTPPNGHHDDGGGGACCSDVNSNQCTCNSCRNRDANCRQNKRNTCTTATTQELTYLHYKIV